MLERPHDRTHDRTGDERASDGSRDPARDEPARPPRAGLRSAPCPRCALTTTHTGDACTRCLARAEHRKIGLLWLVLAAPLLLVGLSALRSVPRWPPPWDHRGSATLGIALVLGGLIAGARGLRGVVAGRSPDGS